MTDESPPIVTLGGRRFQLAQRSKLKHQDWFMRQVFLAGLDLEMRLREGESPADYLARITRATIVSGQARLLVAARLVPEGTDELARTPELAEEICEFLAELEDPADLELYGELVGSVIAAFFTSGLARWMASRSSSTASPTPDGNGTPSCEIPSAPGVPTSAN